MHSNGVGQQSNQSLQQQDEEGGASMNCSLPTHGGIKKQKRNKKGKN